MERLYIGIDVGKDGGIAVLDERQTLVFKSCIPTIGDKVDYKALFGILQRFKDESVVVAIEEVHSIFGASAKSNFSFGEINGAEIMAVEVLAVLYGYSYVMVQPKTWQKKIWSNRDMVYKPKKPDAKTDKKVVDTKATSLLASKRLFPNKDFRKSERSKNAHDGLVDASLIAYYLCLEHK